MGRTKIMVLTTDAKGIVMRPIGMRFKTKKPQEKETKKLKPRLPKDEKLNHKHIIKNASIYFIDRLIRKLEELHSAM